MLVKTAGPIGDHWPNAPLAILGPFEAIGGTLRKMLGPFKTISNILVGPIGDHW